MKWRTDDDDDDDGDGDDDDGDGDDDDDGDGDDDDDDDDGDDDDDDETSILNNLMMFDDKHVHIIVYTVLKTLPKRNSKTCPKIKDVNVANAIISHPTI